MLGPVLATNDDGIDAPGLRALVASLSSRGLGVYTVAPKRPSSGYGKALLYPAPYGEVMLEGAIRAWWVDAPPATAVLAAIKRILPMRPLLVVSGVNRGPNMGLEDLLTSGTIGAAIEAALHGIPAIAVSLATDEGYSEKDYLVAAEFAARLAGEILRNPPPRGAGRLVVVNVPEGLPRGVRLTRLAWNNYMVEIIDHGGRLAPRNHGYRERYWDKTPGSDVEAVLDGYIAVTPVCLSRLREPPAEQRSWLEGILDGLGEWLEAYRREFARHQQTGLP
jgi:5'-nucleotidase